MKERQISLCLSDKETGTKWVHPISKVLTDNTHIIFPTAFNVLGINLLIFGKNKFNLTC